MRFAMCWASVVLGFALSLAACSETNEVQVDRDHCQRLRDHLVDLRLGTAPKGVDVKAHRTAMNEALGEGFVESCQQHTSVAELKCELAAADLNAAHSCVSR